MNQKFLEACTTGDIAFVKSNVEKIDLHESKDGYFINACCRGNFEIAEFLYKKGCKNHLEYVKKLAVDFRYFDTVHFIETLIYKEQLKEKLQSI